MNKAFEPQHKSTRPLMDGIRKAQQRNGKEEDCHPLSTTLVSNGFVNFQGRIADKRKTGGWKASPFIIVNEVVERLAFYAIAPNMVSYLITEMHQVLPNAATHITNWIGAAFGVTVVGAFVADAYMGRFTTMIVFSCFYALGIIMLTLSASIDSLRPPPCLGKVCQPASDSQTAILNSALALIAIGTGGIRPCVSSFGADQFDEEDEKEAHKKYSFFNWFFFAINMGSLFGITLQVYVQVKVGWGWGFGISAIAMFSSIVILVVGMPFYRHQKPMGSAFTRFIQVGVASARNHLRGVEVGQEMDLYEVKTKESDIFGARKLRHTSQYRFLDKAAVIKDAEADTTNRWRVCTVTQVEQFKSFIRILPVWASTIAFYIAFAQLHTFFISQAAIMDRKVGPNFVIPTGSVTIFNAINGLIVVPIYEGWMVPILRRYTGYQRGMTALQRMGLGLFLSIFSMISSALVEKKRRDHSKTMPMSVFWLVPQFFILGTAEVFTYVAQLEFFYYEATDGTRSISSSIFLTAIGIGSWLSTAIVTILENATGGEDKGWLRNDLNQSRLDYFYWVLTVINAINFLIFLLVAWRFKGKDYVSSSVRDTELIDSDGIIEGHSAIKR